MTLKLTCPYCGQPAMSWVRKLALGPAVSVLCKSCGKKVSVHYSAMLAVTPFVASILVAPLTGSFVFGACLVAIGIVVMSAWHMWLIPLAPRQSL
jgi:hypothetical protein